MSETKSEWKWWAGDDEQLMTIGPCDTRDDAIAEAQSQQIGEFEDENGEWKLSFYVVEARQDPLRLADWIGADDLLGRAEDGVYDSARISSECDDGPFFEVTPEQEADLAKRIREACDQWQAAHGLVFRCNTFSHQRNGEDVVIDPLPDDAALARARGEG